MANEKRSIWFNAGALTLIPAGTYPTPIQVATLKDVQLKYNGEIKRLTGSNTFPEDLALGACTVTGSSKAGRLNGALIAACLGGAITTGMKIGVDDERHTISTVGLVATVTNSATFNADLGVYDVTSGVNLTCASVVATNSYTVTPVTGVYTFHSGQGAHEVSIRYTYTSTSGLTITMSNALMGSATKFGLHLYQTYDGYNSGLYLPATLWPSLSFAFKPGDYMEKDISFEACADATGKVAYFYKD
jgi:hypothetical protein